MVMLRVRKAACSRLSMERGALQTRSNTSSRCIPNAGKTVAPNCCSIHVCMGVDVRILSVCMGVTRQATSAQMS